MLFTHGLNGFVSGAVHRRLLHSQRETKTLMPILRIGLTYQLCILVIEVCKLTCHMVNVNSTPCIYGERHQQN